MIKAAVNIETANKVAAVTFGFWVMKICATTLGETAGDLLSMTLNVGYLYSTLILLSAFLLCLFLQLYSQKFNPVLYWLVILCSSTAGTTMSDFIDRTLGFGYAKGALILSILLATVLAVWFAVEKSLSVNPITNKRTELFYWSAILVSNTLGTAVGDYLADNSGLGYLGGAALVGGVIALIALAFKFSNINRIGLFWAAFVLTRPLGATLGDLLTKTHEKGGLDFGTIGASCVLATILAVFIFRQTKQQIPQSA
jgi:uncharacterized membrane-anchored protein